MGSQNIAYKWNDIYIDDKRLLLKTVKKGKGGSYRNGVKAVMAKQVLGNSMALSLVGTEVWSETVLRRWYRE